MCRRRLSIYVYYTIYVVNFIIYAAPGRQDSWLLIIQWLEPAIFKKKIFIFLKFTYQWVCRLISLLKIVIKINKLAAISSDYLHHSLIDYVFI